MCLYHDTWAFPLIWSGVSIAERPHYVFIGCITDSVIHLINIILSLKNRSH